MDSRLRGNDRKYIFPIQFVAIENHDMFYLNLWSLEIFKNSFISDTSYVILVSEYYERIQDLPFPES